MGEKGPKKKFLVLMDVLSWLYAKKEIGGILWEGAWALWRHTPRARAVIALPAVVWTPHPTSAVVFVVQPRYVG